MPAWIAAALGVAGVAEGIFQGNAATDAAKTQAKAQQQAGQLQAETAQKALDFQSGIYNDTKSALAPYLNTGTSALSQLAKMFGLDVGGGMGTGPTPGTANQAMSALSQYPGYQFQQQQGELALDRMGAARGGLLSGGAVKGALDYNHGLSSSAWDKYIATLTGVAGSGQNAANAAGNLGTAFGQSGAQTMLNSGTAQANAILGGGQANASGIIGSSNDIAQGINNGLQSSLFAYKYFNQPNSSQSGVYAPGTSGITADTFAPGAAPYQFNPFQP